MNTNNNDVKAVSVTGLGMMGTTLARLLLQAGYHVTVWNRNPEKAAQLVQEGAILAPDAAAAVKASPVTVICVRDYNAAREILGATEVKAVLPGRVVIHLSSGSPKEAEEMETLIKAQGAAYLDGAIQAAPSQMGRPDTPIFVSGGTPAYQQAEAILRVFGGSVTYFGGQAGAASAIDLATLSAIYGTMTGFLHGARIVEAAGFPVDKYGALVAGITSTFGDFLQHEANVIRSGNFEISQSPMKISIDAMERILQQAEDAGIHSGFPAYAAGLFRQAAKAGLENEELAALIKVLR
ncbi:NAD(P)-dependent oxidoreductase [Chitinophaga sp. XS-30]|uniref:NAD(P)-dependent oxidoreductase n=1 Tax=Chitinophaga sp. XS-30 TaxID=2604421 RepID=UPI0011DC7F01|nr:NAD(P)-binding domain-containing protein [Chitinophaga sp. XS-30]QEH39684.1 NAD(P)-dependent oxidoreductase [Chitinophaga sp. XS-30]